MPQRLQPKIRTLKSAPAKLAYVLAASAALAAFFPCGAPRALAVPVRTPAPSGPRNATPAPLVPPHTLPIDSSLLFVLDDAISSSASRKNDTVRAHLKDPLKIDGKTVAPAGTPVEIKVLDAEPAQMGDVYGFVDIYFMPIRVPDGREIPLRAPTAHLTVNLTAGHESTVGVEDTIEDVIIPYHFLYHAFRKGRNFQLGAGSEIRARTQATISLTPNGAVAITTPQPIIAGGEAPHTSFSAMPFATPAPTFMPHHTPKPTPTPTPVASPSPAQ